MAEQKTKETVEQKEIEEVMCRVEASVVTGFEECARGEAKEKFGTTVQAARGKISWKVPIRRVKEVIKMGSIDNCRVILHSIPHFKFTNDQHDSLARLQKMVPDMDWEKGLCVWREFFDFPHPIAAKPDVIPSREELIDVVIIESRQAKDPNAKRNNKKSVRGKKKDKRKNKKNDKQGDGMKGEAENEGKVEISEKEEGGIKESEEMQNDNQNAAVDNLVESELQFYRECESSNQTHIISETESQPHVAKDASEKASSEPVESERVSEMNEETPMSPESEESPTKEDDGRTRVIIKQVDPNQPQPKIEVKVLIPGPNENVFPTDVDERDYRDLEPMDVDLSMNIGTESNRSAVEDLPISTPNKERQLMVENPSADESADPEDSVNSCSLEDNENESRKKASAATTDFASSVIEKLKSSPPVLVKVLTSSQEVNCATPPPTPNILSTDPLTAAVSVAQCLSPSSTVKDKVTCCDDGAEVIGSSVDPPSLLESCRSVLSAMSDTVGFHKEENVSEMEKENLTPSVESIVKDIKSEDVSGEDSSKSPEKKEPQVKKERDPTKPTFRVTCHRTGDSHAFDSSSAAASLGSAIVRYFNWGVDLKNFDIEILLNIDNEEVSVGIGLTRSSLHNRNLVAFGPTTLRATICYNMLRLCRIKTGDIVCDPLCGTSALPIEGALNWFNSFHFGGDYHELAMERSVKNMEALREKHEEEKRGNLKIGLVQWNLNSFPLRDKCVDVFVSDLPFGHRMGSRSVNRTLYPTLLSEMARTGRSGARACLLTEDKTSLIKSIQTMGRFWQRRLILNVNMGGLSAFVFLLTRTTASFFTPPCSETGSATAESQGKKQPSPSRKEVEVSSTSGETNVETDGIEEKDAAKELSGKGDSQAVLSSEATVEKEATVKERLSSDAICQNSQAVSSIEAPVDSERLSSEAISQNASYCEESGKEEPQKVVTEVAIKSDTDSNDQPASCEEIKKG